MSGRHLVVVDELYTASCDQRLLCVNHRVQLPISPLLPVKPNTSKRLLAHSTLKRDSRRLIVVRKRNQRSNYPQNTKRINFHVRGSDFSDLEIKKLPKPTYFSFRAIFAFSDSFTSRYSIIPFLTRSENFHSFDSWS